MKPSESGQAPQMPAPETTDDDKALTRIRDALAQAMKEQKGQPPLMALAATLSVLSAFLARIEVRLSELERCPFVYEGPHEAGKTYRRGSFVTHHGSLWHANYATDVPPGDGVAWTLAVKRGRDAR